MTTLTATPGTTTSCPIALQTVPKSKPNATFSGTGARLLSQTAQPSTHEPIPFSKVTSQALTAIDEEDQSTTGSPWMTLHELVESLSRQREEPAPPHRESRHTASAAPNGMATDRSISALNAAGVRTPVIIRTPTMLTDAHPTRRPAPQTTVNGPATRQGSEWDCTVLEGTRATHDLRTDGALLLREPLLRHRNKLIAALRQHAVPGVATFEDILRALIAENKACSPETPQHLRLYMGFDGVAGWDGLPLEDGPPTAALAKQLQQAAGKLGDRLRDRECQQMLYWICAHWQVYEKGSCAHHPGSRLSMYRHPTVPMQRESEWGFKAAQATRALRSATVILAREVLREKLTLALLTGDFNTVTAVLQKIPSGVAYLDHYVPPPSVFQLDACHAIHRGAKAYRDTGASDLSERLVQFTGDNLRRAQTFVRMEEDLKKFTPAERDSVYPPPMQALCVALRQTRSAELPHQQQQLQALIAAALTTPNLDTELAQQPFASLRMMLLKCRLLEGVVANTVLTPLRENLEWAHQHQTRVSAMLRSRLLDDKPDVEEIGALARVEYAKQMTSLAIDYVSDGASWQGVDRMNDRLAEIDPSIVTNGPEQLAQKIAIEWVAQQIEATHGRPH